jgi:hypothetical protein
MFYLSEKNPLPPRVILVQGLLRKQGYDVPITGKWDQKTDEAVARFRTGLGLKPQGPIDKYVFPTLIQNTKLKVIHSVDNEAGEVATVTKNHLKKGGTTAIMNPKVIGSGVKTAIDLIIKRAQDHKIAHLSFYGHGNRGAWISIALGDPVHAQEEGRYKDYESMKADYYSYIDYSHFERHRQVLSRLTPLFAPFASVEVHSCKIGKQWKLLNKLADTWAVPVSGGYYNQSVGEKYYVNEYGEIVNSTFSMEGHIVIAYPNKTNLESWAAKVEQSVPSLPRMVNQVQNFVSEAVTRR